MGERERIAARDPLQRAEAGGETGADRRRRDYAVDILPLYANATAYEESLTSAFGPVGIVPMPESKATDRPTLNLGAAALVTLGTGLLVYPLIQGREAGWPAWTFVSMAAASSPSPRSSCSSAGASAAGSRRS